MPYGVVTTLSAPLEVYDQIHSQVMSQTPIAIDGLLLHIGRPSPTGFEVVEVWESRDHYDRYNRELVEPLIAELAGADGPASAGSQQIEEFEVRGLVIPRGGVTR